MAIIPVRKIEDKLTGGVICVCYHCGERFGASGGSCALYCKNCRTAEQRKAMDEENAAIWAAEGKVYVCKFCSAMKASKAKSDGAAEPRKD